MLIVGSTRGVFISRMDIAVAVSKAAEKIEESGPRGVEGDRGSRGGGGGHDNCNSNSNKSFTGRDQCAEA